jgi:hypothetical protein
MPHLPEARKHPRKPCGRLLPRPSRVCTRRHEASRRRFPTLVHRPDFAQPPLGHRTPVAVQIKLPGRSGPQIGSVQRLIDLSDVPRCHHAPRVGPSWQRVRVRQHPHQPRKLPAQRRKRAGHEPTLTVEAHLIQQHQPSELHPVRAPKVPGQRCGLTGYRKDRHPGQIAPQTPHLAIEPHPQPGRRVAAAVVVALHKVARLPIPGDDIDPEFRRPEEPVSRCPPALPLAPS